MGIKISIFCSLLFTSIILAASLSHLMSLPNKINLSKEDYLIAQKVYRGWALMGIIIFCALISLLLQLWMTRNEHVLLLLTATTLLCIVLTQVIFWVYTYPANQQTNNWTTLPVNWEKLRNTWEYSHAAGAVLNLIALVLLIITALKNTNRY